MKKIAAWLVFCSVLLGGLIVSSSKMPGTFQTARAENEGSSQLVDQNGGVRDLTLEEAISLAEENNYTLRLAEIAKRKAYIEAEQAGSLSKVSVAAERFSSSTQLSKYANEKIKENGVFIANKTYEVTKEQVKLLVKKKYFTVLQDWDIVKVDEAALERANKQLENAKASFGVGTVAKTDVLAAEAGVAQAKAALTSAKNDYEVAVIDLKRTIGLDLDVNINLTSTVNYEPMEEINLDDVIRESMKIRLDILKNSATLDNANLKYKALSDYIPGTYDTDLAKIDINTAQLALDDTKKKVVADLTQAYLGIKYAQDTVNYLQAGVDQTRENVRLTNLRYQVGMATSYEVLDASVKLADMEAKYIKALYAYNLAKFNFETVKLAPSSSGDSGSSSSSSTSDSSSSGS